MAGKRRPTRPPEVAVDEHARQMFIGGLGGSLESPRPIDPDYFPEARPLSGGGAAILFKTDEFTLTSATQTITLTYIPMNYSEHVYLHNSAAGGVYKEEVTQGWTRAQNSKTISITAPLGAQAGDVVVVSYAYYANQPTSGCDLEKWEAISCMWGYYGWYGMIDSASAQFSYQPDGIYMLDPGGADQTIYGYEPAVSFYDDPGTGYIDFGSSASSPWWGVQRPQYRGIVKFTSTGWELVWAYPDDDYITGSVLDANAALVPLPHTHPGINTYQDNVSVNFDDHHVYTTQWLQNLEGWTQNKAILLPDGTYLYTHGAWGSNHGQAHMLHNGAWLNFGSPNQYYDPGDFKLRRVDIETAEPANSMYVEFGPDCHDAVLLPDGDLIVIAQEDIPLAGFDDWHGALYRGPSTLNHLDQWERIAAFNTDGAGEFQSAAYSNILVLGDRVFWIQRGDGSPTISRVRSCKFDGSDMQIEYEPVPKFNGSWQDYYKHFAPQSYAEYNVNIDARITMYMTHLTSVDGWLFACYGDWGYDDESAWLAPFMARSPDGVWRTHWTMIFAGTANEYPVTVKQVLGVHAGYLLAIVVKADPTTNPSTAWFVEDNTMPAEVLTLGGVNTQCDWDVEFYGTGRTYVSARDALPNDLQWTANAFLARVPWGCGQAPEAVEWTDWYQPQDYVYSTLGPYWNEWFYSSYERDAVAGEPQTSVNPSVQTMFVDPVGASLGYAHDGTSDPTTYDDELLCGYYAFYVPPQGGAAPYYNNSDYIKWAAYRQTSIGNYIIVCQWGAQTALNQDMTTPWANPALRNGGRITDMEWEHTLVTGNPAIGAITVVGGSFTTAVTPATAENTQYQGIDTPYSPIAGPSWDLDFHLCNGPSSGYTNDADLTWHRHSTAADSVTLNYTSATQNVAVSLASGNYPTGLQAYATAAAFNAAMAQNTLYVSYVHRGMADGTFNYDATPSYPTNFQLAKITKPVWNLTIRPTRVRFKITPV